MRVIARYSILLGLLLQVAPAQQSANSLSGPEVKFYNHLWRTLAAPDVDAATRTRREDTVALRFELDTEERAALHDAVQSLSEHLAAIHQKVSAVAPQSKPQLAVTDRAALLDLAQQRTSAISAQSLNFLARLKPQTAAKFHYLVNTYSAAQ